MKLNDEIKKKNPFRVPDGYFESLTERTMSAIKEVFEEEEKPVRRLHLRPYLALAAAVLGFAVITTVMVKLVSGDRGTKVKASDSEIFADLAVEEIDTYMIESEWSKTEAADITSEKEDISTDAIIDYLMMEGIDINDIYELL
jgi:hypothetical protein